MTAAQRVYASYDYELPYLVVQVCQADARRCRGRVTEE